MRPEVDAAAPEGFDDEQRERFRIDGPKTAQWALRKLTQARAEMAANKDLHAAETADLDAWLTKVNTGPERDALFFQSILRNWHEEQLGENPDRKTIDLPAGVLKARVAPPSLVTTDFDSFVAWAQVHRPEWVRTTYEPVKAEIKKAKGVDPDTGEMAPGIEIVPGELQLKAETR